jgi:hypothetical protein
MYGSDGGLNRADELAGRIGVTYKRIDESPKPSWDGSGPCRIRSGLFFIFEPGTSLVEGGKRIDYSVSRFGEVERIGDLSIYVHKKHWTNLAWRPVDVVVRRLLHLK